MKLNNLLTYLLTAMLAAFLAIGGWLGVQVYQHGSEIVAVVERINALAAKVERLLDREPWRPFRSEALFNEPPVEGPFGWVGTPTAGTECCDCCKCRHCGCGKKSLGIGAEKE